MEDEDIVTMTLSRGELATIWYLLTRDDVQDIPEVVELQEAFTLAIWGANTKPNSEN